jgi:hypothetical protein
MVHVTPVHADRLLFSSTFVARPGPMSQEREFYLTMETGLLLDAVLTQFADGDRDIARSFFASLHAAFTKEFPLAVCRRDAGITLPSVMVDCVYEKNIQNGGL